VRVALVAGAESPARPLSSDPMAWRVWNLSLGLACLGCEVDLFAPGGSRPPAAGSLHIIPGSHGGASSDCDVQAFRWYREILAACDVVHDLSRTGRTVEELYLEGGARYVWTAREDAPGPRFGRRCALVENAAGLKRLPWARVASSPAEHAQAYRAVLEGEAWEEPARVFAHPGRLLFQRWACRRSEGRILNAGCNTDPAGLRELFPGRVVGMDDKDYEEGHFFRTGEKVPIPVDVVHDMTSLPWPFEADSFGIVVLGDVLEDLPDDGCQLAVLREACRVAHQVCVTCPEDTPERDPHHRTTITRERLLGWLAEAGWRPVRVADADYHFVPRGTFALAERA
jgi:hypothetical protein